jgi:putative addiction module component (TIGR02574 family)
MKIMSVAIEEILNLGVKERLELIDEIWDSLAAHPDAVPLTVAQRKELDRRKRVHKQDPSAAKPWSEVHRTLEERNK